MQGFEFKELLKINTVCEHALIKIAEISLKIPYYYRAKLKTY